MADYSVTGGNLPKDSGNRYMMAWYDPSANAFSLPWGYPVSGSAAALAVGHGINVITDTMTATGSNSSGVDLGGYTIRGLIIPSMGSACNLSFLVSNNNSTYVTLANPTNVGLSATGIIGSTYGMDQTVLSHLAPYRYVRVQASNPQTATRSFAWAVAT